MIAWIISLITLGGIFTVFSTEPRIFGLIILGIIIVASLSAIMDFTHKGNT
jgi:hypothetical protein